MTQRSAETAALRDVLAERQKQIDTCLLAAIERIDRGNYLGLPPGERA